MQQALTFTNIQSQNRSIDNAEPRRTAKTLAPTLMRLRLPRFDGELDCCVHGCMAESLLDTVFFMSRSRAASAWRQGCWGSETPAQKQESDARVTVYATETQMQAQHKQELSALFES